MAGQAIKKSPQTLKALSARLMSVQAFYQIIHNGNTGADVVREYLAKRAGMEIEGQILAEPDGALFKKIVTGAEERRAELEEMIRAQLKNSREIENLLHAILVCAVYELLAHHDIDAPIIINDYLHVTDSFFGQGEVKLINGVLDPLAKTLRNK